jgi:hypothetical protein
MKINLKPLMIGLLVFTVGCKESEVEKTGTQTSVARPQICPVPDTPPLCPVPEELRLELLLRSSSVRLVGSSQLTVAEEIDHVVAGTLPVAYSSIPDMILDNDGFRTSSNNHIVKVDRVNVGPFADCGFNDALITIEEKIADCSDMNSDSSTWVGESNGISSEGTWKLVYKVSGNEVWQDHSTKYRNNWCKASGNTQQVALGNGEQIIKCAVLGGSQSLCTDAGYGVEQKGGSLASSVSWKLPTRNDYLRAELHGIRFVLPGMQDKQRMFWTTTSQSTDKAFAWTFGSTHGEIARVIKHNSAYTRCIGRGI